jgi:hypothetical protein
MGETSTIGQYWRAEGKGLRQSLVQLPITPVADLVSTEDWEPLADLMGGLIIPEPSASSVHHRVCVRLVEVGGEQMDGHTNLGVACEQRREPAALRSRL